MLHVHTIVKKSYIFYSDCPFMSNCIILCLSTSVHVLACQDVLLIFVLFIRYTFKIGNIQVVLMSTEHNFTTGSVQYNWIKDTLSKVDRKQTPWLIFAGHRLGIYSEWTGYRFEYNSIPKSWYMELHGVYIVSGYVRIITRCMLMDEIIYAQPRCF